MIEDGRNIRRNILNNYILLTQVNIDDSFSAYNKKGGRQIQNYAQIADCLINPISPETSHIVLTEQHLWKSQSIACGENILNVLMNKTIIDNKKATRKLQDQYHSCAAKMGDFY